MLRNYSYSTQHIIDEKIAQEIKDIISAEFSINLNHFNNFVLRKRLSSALSFLKVTPENIIEKTHKLDFVKIDILLSILYPGENELFRDTDTWIFLRDKILSEISTNSNFKILIYNSTTGEDLYSLMILINEFLFLNKVEIHVTSPSNYAISKIKEGILAQPKNRSSHLNFKTLISNKDISKYLEIKNDTLTFNKELLSNINYNKHTIGEHINLTEFDLILCRNKTLSLNNEIVTVIFNDIISLIKPKGYIVIGINENLPKAFSHHFNIVSFPEKIFLKKAL